MLMAETLWARPGLVYLRGGVPIVFWGYTRTADGQPQIPGPLLEAVVGDDVEVTLHNDLTTRTSLQFGGQDIAPDPVLDSAGRILSLARWVTPGSSISYSFRAERPGTFRYESGTDPERQVLMGLYGPLVVRPMGYGDPGHVNYRTAYGNGTASHHDVEALIVLSEVDLRASQAIVAGAFNPLDYSPAYWLMNGRPFPDSTAPTDPSVQPLSSRIRMRVGQRLLLRLVNSGFMHHTMAFQGGPARIIAEDGWPLVRAAGDASYLKSAVTLSAGKTLDCVLEPPAGEHYLFDRDLVHLVNQDEYPGGMMTIITVRAVYPVEPPIAPGDCAAVLSGIKDVRVSWTDNSADEEGFVVERSEGALGPFTRCATLFAGGTEYLDAGLKGRTLYTYRVLAFNAAGKSAASNEASIETGPFAPPEAPSGLVAVAISGTKVNLTWTDNSATEDGFYVERRTGPTFQQVATLGPNVVSFEDVAVLPMTTYVYRVRSYNGAGASGYSNEAMVATPDARPRSPSNLIAIPISGNQVLLTWTDNSTDETGFIIERSWLVNWAFLEAGRVPENVTQFTDLPLYPYTPWWYRVRAYNAWGSSPPSSPVRVIPGIVPRGLAGRLFRPFTWIRDRVAGLIAMLKRWRR